MYSSECATSFCLLFIILSSLSVRVRANAFTQFLEENPDSLLRIVQVGHLTIT